MSHTGARKLHEKQGMPVDSVEVAVAWYAVNGHRRGAARLGANVETAPSGLQPLPEAAELPDQGTLNRMLTAARVRVTDLEARQAQLDADLRDGRLRPADEVRRVNAEASAALRDRLMSQPSELALRLAAMTDPALIADLLRRALKGVLNDWLEAIGAPAGD